MAAYGRSRQTRAAAETIWQLWSGLSTWQDWNPNVQRVRALVDGSPKRLNVCAKCLKAGKVTRAV